MNTVHKLLAAAFAATCLTSGAFAADAAASAPAAKAAKAAMADVSEACKTEIQTLCPGMKPGDGKFGPCLKQNAPKVSDSCKAAVKGHMGGKAAG